MKTNRQKACLPRSGMPRTGTGAPIPHRPECSKQLYLFPALVSRGTGAGSSAPSPGPLFLLCVLPSTDPTRSFPFGSFLPLHWGCFQALGLTPAGAARRAPLFRPRSSRHPPGASAERAHPESHSRLPSRSSPSPGSAFDTCPVYPALLLLPHPSWTRVRESRVWQRLTFVWCIVFFLKGEARRFSVRKSYKNRTSTKSTQVYREIHSTGN